MGGKASGPGPLRAWAELKCGELKLGRSDQLGKDLEWGVKEFELYPIGKRMGHLILSKG